MNAKTCHRPAISRNVFRLFASAIGLSAILLLSVPQARAEETNSTPQTYDMEIAGGGLFGQGNPTNCAADIGDIMSHFFRKRYPRASFILSPELRDVEISDMKLGNVGAADAIMTELEAMRVASGNKFSVKANWPTPGVHNSGVFFLEANPAAFPSKNNKQIVEAFNLSGLSRKSNAIHQQLDQAAMELEMLRQNFGENHPEVKTKEKQLQFLRQNLGEAEFKETEIIGHIQDVVNPILASMDLPTAPAFRYHPEMSLLVVVGSQEQIDVTRKIVNALLDKPPLPETAPPEPKANPNPRP